MTALPVIKTCGECAHCRKATASTWRGYCQHPSRRHGGMGGSLPFPEVNHTQAPPDNCPLRALPRLAE